MKLFYCSLLSLLSCTACAQEIALGFNIGARVDNSLPRYTSYLVQENDRITPAYSLKFIVDYEDAFMFADIVFGAGVTISHISGTVSVDDRIYALGPSTPARKRYTSLFYNPDIFACLRWYLGPGYVYLGASAGFLFYKDEQYSALPRADQLYMARSSADYQCLIFGGLAGISFPISEHLDVNLEAAHKLVYIEDPMPEHSFITAGIRYNFW